VRGAKLFGPEKQLVGYSVRIHVILVSTGCPVCGKQQVRQTEGSCTTI